MAIARNERSCCCLINRYALSGDKKSDVNSEGEVNVLLIQIAPQGTDNID
jgi:hypothetical protein